MCYRCEICKEVSNKGQARLVHRIMRKRANGAKFREEIAVEMSVCVECHRDLERGATVAQLTTRSRSDLAVEATAPKTGGAKLPGRYASVSQPEKKITVEEAKQLLQYETNGTSNVATLSANAPKSVPISSKILDRMKQKKTGL